jgi:type I restriction enzyme S subunit
VTADVLINHIVALESGGRPKGGASQAGDVPSLGAEHLDGRGGFKLNSVKHIPRDYYNSLKRGKICVNDILIVKDGATTGKTSYVDIGFPFVDAAVNEHVFILRTNQDSLLPRYAFHFLNSPHGQTNILSDFRGATVGGISKGFIEKVHIPLPSLPEQKRITAILDQADVLRNKRRTAIAKLEELLQSVFLDMFGDPVTNPKGWEVQLFGNITDSRLGKMLDKKAQSGNYHKPYLANFNVKWGRFELDELRSMDFTPRDQDEFRLCYGDLLVCEGGEVGRCAIWDEQLAECYYQKALHRVRCKVKLCVPEYIQYYLWFMARGGGFKDYVTSATIAHLTGVKLKSLKVPLPPFNLQKKFQEIVHKWKIEKKVLCRADLHLDSLFSSLQQRAFRGEL